MARSAPNPAARAGANPAAVPAAAAAPPAAVVPPVAVAPAVQRAVAAAAAHFVADLDYDDCLDRLELSAPARAHWYDQGFRSVYAFAMNAPFESMDSILQVVTKRGTIPDGVTISVVAMFGLKAFRAWILYRQTRGQDVNPTDFDQEAIQLWRGRLPMIEGAVLLSLIHI
jgi:hypothetical protein